MDATMWTLFILTTLGYVAGFGYIVVTFVQDWFRAVTESSVTVFTITRDVPTPHTPPFEVPGK